MMAHAAASDRGVGNGAEHGPPSVAQLLDGGEIGTGEVGRAARCCGELFDPPVDIAVPVGGQPRDVAVAVLGEHDADGWHVVRGEVTAAPHGL